MLLRKPNIPTTKAHTSSTHKNKPVHAFSKIKRANKEYDVLLMFKKLGFCTITSTQTRANYPETCFTKP